MIANAAALIAVAAVITMAESPADAAIVLLKDGSRLNGTIVSATAQDIRLHTKDGARPVALQISSRAEGDI